jgi:hypothetical protein
MFTGIMIIMVITDTSTYRAPREPSRTCAPSGHKGHHTYAMVRPHSNQIRLQESPHVFQNMEDAYCIPVRISTHLPPRACP